MDKTVVIAGAGTMGASLAQVYCKAGYRTVLYNRSRSGLDRAKDLISINQKVLVDNGILSDGESKEIEKNIEYTTSKDCFRETGLVVESIVEDLEIKQSFWREVSPLTADDAILATNTSGLHISEIAKAVYRPERFIGQHWLNPPHLLPLCEIVVGDSTSEETTVKMKGIVQGLDKLPVVVKDINGFLINRLQFAVLREALYIVEQGYASYEDIDNVMKGGLGLRYAALGPFGVADMGGLDTFEHINSYLNRELCDSKEGSRVLRSLVEEGKLGVKSGEGFYDYSGDKKREAIENRDKLYIDLAKTLYFGGN